MSRHRVVGFMILKCHRPFKDMPPYSVGFLHDSVDEYDAATKTHLVKLHRPEEFGCDAFDQAYGGSSPDSRTLIGAYTFGQRGFQKYLGTHDTHFESLGYDDLYEVLYFVQTPYPLDTDLDADREVWRQINKPLEKMVEVLNREYATFRRQSQHTVFVERNVFAGYAPNQGLFPPASGRSMQPYMMDVDHGQIEVDPREPRFDSSAGETGQWVDPMEPPFEWPSQG